MAESNHPYKYIARPRLYLQKKYNHIKYKAFRILRKILFINLKGKCDGIEPPKQIACSQPCYTFYP